MSRIDRLKALIEEFGTFAVIFHFAVWFISIAVCTTVAHLGLSADFGAGLDPGTLPGAAWLEARLGTFGLALAAGYGVTQLLKIPRIAVTLALTPILARRFRPAAQ